MTSFKRWLGCLVLVFSVALLSMGCQAVFGDFKVGSGAHSAGQGGNDGNGSGGGSAGNGQSFGPIVVVPTSGLFTSDNGGQARFYVSLAKAPLAPITVTVASSNEKEGTVSPASLVFTPTDYNAAQAVTVTGNHDDQPGDQAYSVTLGPVVSDEPDFNGAHATIPITNIDNDSAGVFVTPKSGLVTTETGGQAFFTVQLNTEPKSDVIIALTSSDSTLGVVTPPSLTMTKANWKSPQMVTITGQNDDLAGGDRPYQITVGAPASDDPAYAKLPAQTVDVVNRDNDVAGANIVLVDGIDASDGTRLRTTEGGGFATFTVALNKQPTANVEVSVTSTSDEGTVSPATLTFTPLNYASPQKVTVVGVDDSDADGDQLYQVKLGPVKSDDGTYNQLTSADLPYVNVVNIDNDQPRITVTLLTGVSPSDPSQLFTTEKRDSATFSVKLESKPTGPVRIGVTSSNENEGLVSPDELDFTPDDWSVAQKVTVTGVDDDKKDGDVVYTVGLSAPTTDDPGYQKLPASNVKVVNRDDDVAGITVPTLISGVENGTKLITTEHNQGQATFSVALLSQPKADVTLTVKSSNTNEGTVSPATLLFSTASFAKPQTVTVTGVDEFVADGDQAYTVTVESKSDDPDYVGLSQLVRVTNKDDDSAYIYAPVTTGTTYENGSAVAKFDISLHSQPNKDVNVTFTSTKTSEGTVSPMSMVFTPANWQMPQQLTVTGVDDKIDDGDQSYTVQVNATSQDTTGYMNSAIALSLVNKNDDSTGLKLNPTTPLSLAEAGGKATFTVVLTSQPTGNVVVSLTSSDTKQGTVAGPNASSPGLLTFTPSGTGVWSSPQTVTVTGVDNSVAGANPMYTITLKTTSATADTKYAALAASTVSVTNTNEDMVGFVVTGPTCATMPGASVMYSVVLKSQPLGPVTLALASDLPMTAGTVTPAALTFTTTDWGSSHPFTVTGVDDGSMGQMTPYTIATTATSALDSSYNNFSVADVACVNTTPAAPPTP